MGWAERSKRGAGGAPPRAANCWGAARRRCLPPGPGRRGCEQYWPPLRPAWRPLRGRPCSRPREGARLRTRRKLAARAAVGI